MTGDAKGMRFQQAPGLPRLALLLLCMVCATEAHICIMSPPQRGPMNVTIPGDPSCYRRTGYCGGIQPGPSPAITQLKAGEVNQIEFMQNLNHWNPARPGKLDISISHNPDDPSESDFQQLFSMDDFPANEMVVQTVFNVSVSMPDTPCDHCILRARYVSNNAMEVDPPDNTDAIFYNCADVSLVAHSPVKHGAKTGAARRSLPAQPGPAPALAVLQAPAREEPSDAAATPYSCKVPPAWHAAYSEVSPGGLANREVWWDAAAQQSRIDRRGWLGPGWPSAPPYAELSVINDYSKPIEYVNFVTNGTCHMYGNDALYLWAFAESKTMHYIGRTQTGIDRWSGACSSTEDWCGSVWRTKDMGGGLCEPLGYTRGGVEVTITEFNLGPIPAGVFTPAANCISSPTFAGCRAESVRAQWEADHGENVAATQ